MLVSQNDLRWKGEKINGSEKMTIGKIGCLLTSIVNVNNLHCKQQMTPLTLDAMLKVSHGYTNDNLIVWEQASKILDCTILPFYTGKIEYDTRSFYVVNYINSGYGHFTNLIENDDNTHFIFDVWDGEYKTISTSKIRRYVKFIFKY